MDRDRANLILDELDKLTKELTELREKNAALKMWIFGQSIRSDVKLSKEAFKEMKKLLGEGE